MNTLPHAVTAASERAVFAGTQRPCCAGCLIQMAEKEIRTPVAALVAVSQALVEELGADHPCAGFARLARQESLRVQELVADVLGAEMPARLRPVMVRSNRSRRINNSAGTCSANCGRAGPPTTGSATVFAPGVKGSRSKPRSKAERSNRGF